MSHQRVSLNNLGKPRLIKAAAAIPLEDAAKQILVDNRDTPESSPVAPAAPADHLQLQENQHSPSETHELATMLTREKEHLIQKMFRLPLSVVEELERFKDLKRYGTMTDIVLRGLRPELDRIRRLEAKKQS